jgi:calcineurin-like phosphoesterase family protein
MSTFYISDLHFGHKNVLAYAAFGNPSGLGGSKPILDLRV